MSRTAADAVGSTAVAQASTGSGPPGPQTTGGQTAGPPGPGRRLAGVEARAVGLAVVAWLGADLAVPSLGHRWCLVAAVLVLAVGFVRRAWPLLAVGVFLGSSGLGALAAEAYQPLAAGPLDAEVLVVGDPRPLGSGWRVDVKLADGSRIEARGYGPAGWDLSDVSVGETYRLSGRLTPAAGSEWLRVRHITARASVDGVEKVRGRGLVWSVPEWARQLVIEGTATMDERQRALYLGLVIGDDRFQPLGQRLNFRAAGLTHLLAVSGQNVAFVLAVARVPLLALGRRWRLPAFVSILVVFAVMTRMEPSVLRATASAVLAVWAAATGRERSGLIILSLAVVVLLAADPFLVDSVGFQLSVAASAGILVLGPAIDRRLPGPGWITGPLATTLSAQVGVAPVLGAYFGPVSVVSVPANLAAGWAAGAVMVFGLTVGVVAGLVPDSLAVVLQAPAVVLIGWLELVARTGARAPFPTVGPVSLIVLTTACLVCVPRGPSADGRPAGDGRRPSGVIRALAVVATLAVLTLAGWPRPPADGPCGPGLTFFGGDGDRPSVLVVESEAYSGSVESCLERGLRSADFVVATRGTRSSATLVAALRDVLAVGHVLAPSQHRIVGAERLADQGMITTGGATIRLIPDGRHAIAVDVQRTGPDR